MMKGDIMAFQSDVYLGWQGEDKIREVLKETSLKLEKLDQKYFSVMADSQDPIRNYLSQKYEINIPAAYDMANLTESLHCNGPDYEIEPSDYLFGVQLTQRYRPVFLDFRDAYGGLYVKKIDKDFLEDIEWMRRYLISRGLDRYETAEVFIRDEWY